MPFGRLKKPRNPASDGLSLMEVGLAMMILGILSVGVSALVKTGVESQMARNSDLTMQSIGMDIVEDIRRDVRTADTISVSGGGNTLNLVNASGTIVYQLSGSGQFSRSQTGAGGNANRIYNDPAQFSKPRYNVVCPNTCFTALLFNSDPTPMPRQLRVNEIQVQEVATAGSGTIIDRAFGASNFTVRAFTFSLASATEFE